LAEKLFTRNPRIIIESSLENLKRLLDLIKFNAKREVNSSIKEIEAKLRTLSTLNPREVLKRGYAICTRNSDTEIIKDVSAVNVGESLFVNFYKGNIECEVKNKRGESTWLKNH